MLYNTKNKTNTEKTYSSCDGFTTVMFEVEVFSVLTPYRVLLGYQRFRGQCCLHLQGEVWRWRQHWHLKRWYPTTTQHSVRTQRTSTWKYIIYTFSNMQNHFDRVQKKVQHINQKILYVIEVDTHKHIYIYIYIYIQIFTLKFLFIMTDMSG
jgi:hypothetical protein